MPLLKAWPDEPRIEKAVMLVPNSDSTNTNGPSERPARKKSSAPARRFGTTEGEDADVDDRDQVEPDDGERDHSPSSRCEGQARRTSTAMIAETARV